MPGVIMPKVDREQWIRQIRAHERHIRKLAQEQFKASLMNNTKWRELVEAVQDLAIGSYRVKFIDDEEIWSPSWILSPSPTYIEGEGGIGPEIFVAIEWLEVLPPRP